MDTIQRAPRHFPQHAHSRDHHMRTLARWADRIESTGNTCTLGLVDVETGSAYVLAVHSPDGRLIGRFVSTCGGGITCWVVEGSVSTRVSMHAFNVRATAA